MIRRIIVCATLVIAAVLFWRSCSSANSTIVLVPPEPPPARPPATLTPTVGQESPVRVALLPELAKHRESLSAEPDLLVEGVVHGITAVEPHSVVLLWRQHPETKTHGSSCRAPLGPGGRFRIRLSNAQWVVGKGEEEKKEIKMG